MCDVCDDVVLFFCIFFAWCGIVWDSVGLCGVCEGCVGMVRE